MYDLVVTVNSSDELKILSSAFAESVTAISEGFTKNDRMEDIIEEVSWHGYEEVEEIYPKKVVIGLSGLTEKEILEVVHSFQIKDFEIQEPDTRDYVKEYYQSFKTFNIGHQFQIVPG